MEDKENNHNVNASEEQMHKDLQFKFQMFEQQIQMIYQQLQSVEQAMQDISELSIGLDEIKKDKEIMAPLGRGIFVKAKTISEDLLVDIGEKNYVKKTIQETKDLIQEQVEKLEKVKEELNCGLEKINQELTETFMANQKNHSCGDKCNCEDECSCEDESCECGCKEEGKK